MGHRTFYEFFAGGGMARLGLGSGWTCLLANDIDPKKIACYAANFGGNGVASGDIYDLTAEDMPGRADLAWASFPCQDLSLAGNRAGLAGERSGAFWGFWKVVNALNSEARAPRVLVLENVIGTLTSHDGADFRELAQAIVSLGYDFGAVVIDAIHFLPQSRPRLFIVCVRRGEAIDPALLAEGPLAPWHSLAVCRAAYDLPRHLKAAWRWWRLPDAPARSAQLADLLEPDDAVTSWHEPEETARLVAMMSPANFEKVAVARRSGVRVAGTIYRRTRASDGEGRVQRAEVRFDGVAGCLRTPGGGSSRQTVIVVEGTRTRSRLLTVREAARLMGVPDSYKTPANYNDGYHIFGDGLAVPAVAFLRAHVLEGLVEPASAHHRSSSVTAA